MLVEWEGKMAAFEEIGALKMDHRKQKSPVP